MVTFQAFIGGRRPQVPLHALFQAQQGTWLEPPTFRQLSGYFSLMKESKAPWMNSNLECWEIRSQRSQEVNPNYSVTDPPKEKIIFFHFEHRCADRVMSSRLLTVLNKLQRKTRLSMSGNFYQVLLLTRFILVWYQNYKLTLILTKPKVISLCH